MILNEKPRNSDNLQKKWTVSIQKQGRKRPLDTPKRMIERREREGEREKKRRRRDIEREGEIRERNVRDIKRESERERHRERE